MLLATSDKHMLTLAAVTSIVVAAGMLVNLFMVAVVIRRRERVMSTAPNDFVARITVRRTLRNELCFLLCQVILFGVSLFSSAAVIPDAPHLAIVFYYVSAVARVVVSLLLLSCSLMDLLDRGRIHKELNRLNLEAAEQAVREMDERKVQDHAAKLGLDVDTSKA